MAIVLLASDLASLRKELRTTLEGPDLLIEEVANGPKSSPASKKRRRPGVLDCRSARWRNGHLHGTATRGVLRRGRTVAVLMLLDRRPDVFLARRSGAEGFLVKPLDPQRLRSAVRALLRGEEYEDESLRPSTVRVGSTDIQ